MDNPILQAVRQNRNALWDVVNNPDYHLNTHKNFLIERMAFDNIQKQAFGKRRYATASENRHRLYRNYLSEVERVCLRIEVNMLQTSFLRGYQLYEEVARQMTIKFRSHYDWKHVKSILEMASEVISDLELNLNQIDRKSRKKAA